ncbi:hypothetical protein [Caballeronia fortuita]|nr:hypothetical protein [Caballeronia fortuita]
MRTRIADLIASVSQRENWKLQRCAAIARRVEQASVYYLEAVQDFPQGRDDGQQPADTPAVLAEFFVDNRHAPEGRRAPQLPAVVAFAAPDLPVHIAQLHGAMRTLESRVASTPGITCGLQGIRIMRMVALMSKARSAQIAKMRKSGTQAFYRHS